MIQHHLIPQNKSSVWGFLPVSPGSRGLLWLLGWCYQHLVHPVGPNTTDSPSVLKDKLCTLFTFLKWSFQMLNSCVWLHRSLTTHRADISITDQETFYWRRSDETDSAVTLHSVLVLTEKDTAWRWNAAASVVFFWENLHLIVSTSHLDSTVLMFAGWKRWKRWETKKNSSNPQLTF